MRNIRQPARLAAMSDRPAPHSHVLHRRMKLWEVASAFGRSHDDILRSVVCAEPWREQYCEVFSDLTAAIASQDRALLDQEMPLALTREIARRYPLQFQLYTSARCGDVFLLRLVPAPIADMHETELSALAVHDRFGGAAIEEVQEYGSAWVIDRPGWAERLPDTRA